jgi:hypothetical protein
MSLLPVPPGRHASHTRQLSLWTHSLDPHEGQAHRAASSATNLLIPTWAIIVRFSRGLTRYLRRYRSSSLSKREQGNNAQSTQNLPFRSAHARMLHRLHAQGFSGLSDLHPAQDFLLRRCARQIPQLSPHGAIILPLNCATDGDPDDISQWSTLDPAAQSSMTNV